MSARLQTWFPFNVQICLNGREWLATPFRRRGRSDFKRVDNCFTWLGNPERAQRLMDEQLTTDWPRALDKVARFLNPCTRPSPSLGPCSTTGRLTRPNGPPTSSSKDPRTLAEIYPSLVRHAMEHFKSPDVMRFLGRKAHGNFTGEIIASFKNRPEGVRVRHWVRGNPIKIHDKAGRVLRAPVATPSPSRSSCAIPRSRSWPSRCSAWARVTTGSPAPASSPVPPTA